MQYVQVLFTQKKKHFTNRQTDRQTDRCTCDNSRLPTVELSVCGWDDGGLVGVGLGLLYLPNIVAVSYYFQRRRAFATGVAVCGAGVGCFVFAPLCKYLLTVYAWKSAMLIVSGITLNGVVFGSLLVPLRPLVHYRRPRAKIFVDRWCEKVAQKTKRQRSRSDCTEDQPEILKVYYANVTRVCHTACVHCPHWWLLGVGIALSCIHDFGCLSVCLSAMF